MSKAIAAFIVTIGLLAPVASFAAVDCSVTPNDPACQHGGPNPENITNPWGGTNSDVPHILPGQSAKDQWGNVFACPWYFTNYCVDLTHTTYYISRHQ